MNPLAPELAQSMVSTLNSAHLEGAGRCVCKSWWLAAWASPLSPTDTPKADLWQVSLQLSS